MNKRDMIKKVWARIEEMWAQDTSLDEIFKKDYEEYGRENIAMVYEILVDDEYPLVDVDWAEEFLDREDGEAVWEEFVSMIAEIENNYGDINDWMIDGDGMYEK